MRVNPEFLRRGYLKKQSQKPAFGRKSEARNPKRVERVHLKKQSQFPNAKMKVSSLRTKDYENEYPFGARKNKPNFKIPPRREILIRLKKTKPIYFVFIRVHSWLS